MAAIPECYRDCSRWEIIRTQVEHEYWRNVERNLTPDNMPRRVYELADCLQRDANFTMRAVGGNWRFSSSNSNLKFLYDHFGDSRRRLALNGRTSAVETAAFRLIPDHVEWELYEDQTSAAIVITGVKAPRTEYLWNSVP